MNLLLIETSGNQNYIFSTNKLRENIGASELTYQIGTKYVLNEVSKHSDKVIYDDNPLQLQRNLLDTNLNPIVGNGNKVEVIIATSGKAILLVDEDENQQISKEIIRNVTKNALKDMPGLKVNGAIVRVKDDLSDIHEAIGEVHRKLDENRYQIPSNEQRFMRLPFVAPCATSGLPAQTFDKEGDKEILVSQLSKTKAENKTYGIQRIKKVFSGIKFISSEKIEKCEWVAVIHADGNGLGEIFLNFEDVSKAQNRKYIELYRKFSLKLDRCTISATKVALENLWNVKAKEFAEKKRVNVGELSEDDLEKIKIPVVPLVFGGDDLTVLCEGKYAVKFVKDFLDEFFEQTKSNELVKSIVGEKGLGICAGIAIIKPHYPFHQAYELAEQLLKSAKQVKEKSPNTPATALDYHVLYDSAGASLDEIRGKLGKFKVARPYVIDYESNGDETNAIWLQNRDFKELITRVKAMIEEEDGKRKLPNSQLHTLRERLHLGREETEAYASTIKHRYKSFGNLEPLYFTETNEKNKNDNFTYFLDAIEISEFWEGFDKEEKTKEEKVDE